MNINKLKALVAQGECETLEFKKSTGVLQAAFETICAFLNGEGGTVLIGVTDGGRIIGQEVGDITRREIANHVSKLEPPAQPQLNVDYVQVEQGKHVIVVTVASGKHMPYTYDGRAFYRNQSATMRMPQHRYEQLIVERGQLNHSWEILPAIGYDVDFLDHAEIRRTVERGIKNKRIPSDASDESIEEILSRFDLLLSDGRLKNAAAVLFAKKVYSAYPQCLIKMGRFRGNDDLGDFVDNQQFHGNAFQILSAADNFVTKHLSIASFFDENSFERRDEPTVPVLALREAFINAIIHRDYSNRSASIYLSIFDDHLEIWNNGILPKQLKVSDLKKLHKSYPRNELISEIFFNRGLVESWGKGTNRMIKLCKDSNLPEPKFTEYSGGFAVTFKFREPIGNVFKSVEVKIELNLRQKNILSVIEKHGSVSVQQIVAALDNPSLPRTVQRDLVKLKSADLVKNDGKGRATVWIFLKHP